MNLFIGIMLVFALLGLLDKMLNNRFGFASAFDEGLGTMGNIALSMSGFYCIAIAFIQGNADTITNLTANSPIDSSIFIGSLLAPDMGGFSIVEGLGNQAFLVFSGVALTSTLGATISFQLPIFLSSIKKEEIPTMIQGLLFGILTLPIVLILLAFGLGLPNMWINLLPIFILCGVIVLGLVLSYQKTIAVLTIFAQCIKVISILFFTMVVAQLFFPKLSFTTPALIEESLVIVLRMCIVVCGSMVLSKILLQKGEHVIQKIASSLHTNDVAIVGLLMNLTSSLAMLPLFSKMDTRGKILNAAFSVSGAYVLGGQLGFISSVCSGDTILIYIGTKLTLGILSIIAVQLFYKKAR